MLNIINLFAVLVIASFVIAIILLKFKDIILGDSGHLEVK